MTVACGSFLAFIVSGDVNVTSSVTQLQVAEWGKPAGLSVDQRFLQGEDERFVVCIALNMQKLTA